MNTACTHAANCVYNTVGYTYILQRSCANMGEYIYNCYRRQRINKRKTPPIISIWLCVGITSQDGRGMCLCGRVAVFVKKLKMSIVYRVPEFLFLFLGGEDPKLYDCTKSLALYIIYHYLFTCESVATSYFL